MTSPYRLVKVRLPQKLDPPPAVGELMLPLKPFAPLQFPPLSVRLPLTRLPDMVPEMLTAWVTSDPQPPPVSTRVAPLREFTQYVNSRVLNAPPDTVMDAVCVIRAQLSMVTPTFQMPSYDTGAGVVGAGVEVDDLVGAVTEDDSGEQPLTSVRATAPMVTIRVGRMGFLSHQRAPAGN